MLSLWDSKVTFVLVSQCLGLALCFPFQSVSGVFVTPCLIVSLGGRKKRGKKERGSPPEKDNNKPPANFKTVQWVMLIFLHDTGRGGLGFPTYGFERMGTRSGSQYSQFPSLWPGVLGELPGSNQPLSCSQYESISVVEPGRSWAHGSAQLLSPTSQYETSRSHNSAQPLILGMQCETSRVHSSGQPLTLGVCSWNHPRHCWRVPYKAAALQFLTSTLLFTQPNFPTSL